MLLTVKEVAAMLSLEKRSVHRMNKLGQICPPIKVGGSVRWRLSDIEKWIELGCCSKEEFESIKQ